MSGIWQHATKENPCVVCGKPDWCSFGHRAMLCQRVESKFPHSKGGWFHWYGESKPEYIPQPKAAPARINAAQMIKRWSACGPTIDTLQFESERLGVTKDSLISLGACYAHEKKAYAFPMSDGLGGYIGIRLRNAQGFKWAVPGSRQGIFLPVVPADSQLPRIAYLPEGPTDTAACLTLGLFAIGRPTCNSGNEFIAQALRRLQIYRVVIVADNDEQKINGKRPGLEGAIKLKKELGLNSVIWMPPAPIKDVREFVNKGGTRQMIESEIKNKIWSKQ